MAFNAEQKSNAAIIIRTGRALGASDRDILIALMTAMQESDLRNLNYGDRDSIGMFQQRNAWGSRADRLDPVKSTRMFFLGGAEGQRGLFDFADRNSKSLTEAAQAVQVSAYPDAYAKHEGDARSLLGETGGQVPPGWPSEAPVADFLQPEVLDIAAGMRSPQMAVGGAEGLAAATAPGLESGDRIPVVQEAVPPEVEELLADDSGGGAVPVEDGGGDLGRRVQFRGVTLDQYTINRLLAAEKALGYELRLPQGSYNPGGVAASAGTHDGGGALDVSVRGMNQQKINNTVRALRQAGFAAWYRTKDDGDWSPHIHAIAIGNPWLSPVAQRQVEQFHQGLNGLASRKPDTAPRVGVGAPAAAPTVQMPKAAAPQPQVSLRRELAIRNAKALIGTPYLHGGEDDRGVDSAGLTYSALRSAEVEVPRLSFQQARYGQRVDLSALQPGDLAATDGTPRLGGRDHVAIWLGDGLIIEQPSPGLSVRIREIDDDEGWFGVSLDY